MYPSFSNPWFLVLLPLGAFVLWWSARVSYADLTPTRRKLAWGTRGVLLCSLVLALAGTRLMKPARSQLVVFAADQSVSIPDTEKKRTLEFVRQSLRTRRPQDRGALVMFGREALVESESLAQPSDVQCTSTPMLTHTNLAAALRLAMGVIPAETAGRVVLLSDGNENLGEATAEALLARANGIAVDVVPLQSRTDRDVIVHTLNAPAQAKQGEPLSAQASISSTVPTRGTLRLLVDDRPMSNQQVTLASGTSTVELSVRLGAPGFHKVEVQVDVPGETCRENNRAMAFVRVRGKPKVLIVAQQSSEAAMLAKALRAQELDVTSGGPEVVPTNSTDLEQYDCLLLSDFPSYQFGPKQMAMIRDAVRDRGLGLGMIGGEYSFGAGGYYDTPIEEALPVSMDLKKDREYLPASVMIVMDTSGSMGMEEDGYQKIELAATASCTVVDLLQPVDALGFMASDPTPTMISPMRRLSDKDKVKRDIKSVRAGGGGICVFPSLQAAYGVLRQVKSPVRHIILLADGSDCDDQSGSVELTQQMAKERITVSAIAFGDGPHVPFLKDVVRVGGGKFYLTDKARDLKGIFTREAMTLAKSVLVEEKFRPRLADTSPVLSGLDLANMPALLGYVATRPKPLATLPLLTHKQDPLLAHWQYGLGRSMAFTSDATAHWAVQWLAWPDFSRFWAQTLRWCLRQTPPESLHPRVEMQGDQAKLIVEAVQGDGALLNGLEMTAKTNQPEGGTEQVVLSQTGPGRYEAQLNAPELGSYVTAISASGPGGFRGYQTLGFAVPYPPDLADTHPNLGLLKELAETTGGEMLTDPAQSFRLPSRVPLTPLDMSRWLLWLAALLLPLDVAVRRLALKREDFTPFLRAVATALALATPRKGPRPQPERATVAALLTRKQQVRRQEPPPLVEPPMERPPEAPETVASTEMTPVTEVKQAPPGRTTSRLLEAKRGRR